MIKKNLNIDGKKQLSRMIKTIKLGKANIENYLEVEGKKAG
jgi:hypothetical protein